jgi:hypothetical protein
MLRFSIKSLIVLTAMVAAYVLMVTRSAHGPTVAGFVGMALYFGLVAWAISRSVNKPNNEPANATREGDGENPTT